MLLAKISCICWGYSLRSDLCVLLLQDQVQQRAVAADVVGAWPGTLGAYTELSLGELLLTPRNLVTLLRSPPVVLS